jgi:hypothetical protein
VSANGADRDFYIGRNPVESAAAKKPSGVRRAG